MLRAYTCDLHIHTCLSPCGDLDMHPRALVQAACAKSLDVIAICDHNSCENVAYVMRAASGTGLTVLAGMEVNSREEVHVVALLGGAEEAQALQEQVYARLKGMNDEEVFGVQAVVNEHGEVEGLNDRLLIGATDIPLEDLVRMIHDLEGLAIAAHIDREAFGIIGQLGFIPPDIRFDALEISAARRIAKARNAYPELAGYAFITASDAHFIPDIGRATVRMHLAAPTLAEIRAAFLRRDGRFVEEPA